MLQWAFALPVTLLRLPYSLVESALWSAMLYWIIGFDPDAGRYHQASSRLCIMQVQAQRQAWRQNLIMHLLS